MKSCFLAASLLLSAAAFAAAPQPDDYAQGIRVDIYQGRPLAELLLPDSVYRGVTRADLGDVRVFNSDGIPVSHALCASPVSSAPVVTRESLPVFELQAPAPDNTHGTHVEVETAAGTQVRIQEGEAASTTSAATQTWAHVIDARPVHDELHSIEFDWSSPDGASQANVRVEASDDLNAWRTVVGATTLLRVSRAGQELQRNEVQLVQQHYNYLRVVRTDGGPPLQIAGVTGERVTRAAEIEPTWFNATAQSSPDVTELRFDAERIAPIGYARIILPQQNSSVRVRVQSRPDSQAEWRERWSGEVYSIVTQGQRRVSPPATLDGEHDRYWRVLYAKPSDALNPAPGLELGYRPAKLRFLAQGAGPFTLAFGSRRAEVAPMQQCGSLLSDVSARDMAELVGEAAANAPQTLGGDTALKPLPRKTPVRLIVLWGVLILGAGLLVAMAFALLKRLNAPQT